MAGKKNPNILPVEQIIALYKSGMTQREIAVICKCSSSRISAKMKGTGTEMRAREDYPVTEKQRAARAANGKKHLGMKRTEETRKRISEAKKLYRKCNDYEFGGHEKKRKDGYIKVFVPDHPFATKEGFVLKHRLVVERAIGRYLREDEDVHHINHIRDDNRIENLQVMTHAEHAAMHTKERHRKTKEETT